MSASGHSGLHCMYTMYSGKAGTRVRLGLAVAGADEVEVVIDNPSDSEKGQQHLPWLARSGY